MPEDRFDLGDERVVDLQRLHWTQRRFSQQRPSCGDGVDGVGLVEATSAALRGRALAGHLTSVEAGCDERDRDVSTPASRALHTDLVDTVRGQQCDRVEIAGAARREGPMRELDPVGVDDADRDAVLVRVDPADRRCHHGDLLLLVVGASGGSGNGRSASSDPSRVEQAPFKTGAHLPVPRSTRQVWEQARGQWMAESTSSAGTGP